MSLSPASCTSTLSSNEAAMALFDPRGGKEHFRGRRSDVAHEIPRDLRFRRLGEHRGGIRGGILHLLGQRTDQLQAFRFELPDLRDSGEADLDPFSSDDV